MKNHNAELLGFIKNTVDELNQSNSSKEKIEKLKVIYESCSEKEQEYLEWALKNTYSPYITFGVTSESVKNWMGVMSNPDLFESVMSLENLLKVLSLREKTGHDALRTIYNTIVWLTHDQVEIFYNILDKNLKIRMDAKSINKAIPGLIPIFEVSLCNVYAERKHKVDFRNDLWMASRKMDGCRCVVITDLEGNSRAFSRQGKEFKTLDNLLNELKNYPELRGKVLDGEMCIIDENGDENFKSIMKEITRKNHTISNPYYQVFDIMRIDEFQNQCTDRLFDERWRDLNNIFTKHPSPYINVPSQTWVRSEKELNEKLAKAREKGWEGLVIRKNDCEICKRSDSMLKVKEFFDDEYIVEDLEMGPFRVIKDGREVEEEVMTNAFITHKGNRVSIGSGWSLEQRRYYKEHPEDLIGKTITVQYFEETTDKNGNKSLRFPVCKCIYENGRDL